MASFACGAWRQARYSMATAERPARGITGHGAGGHGGAGMRLLASMLTTLPNTREPPGENCQRGPLFRMRQRRAARQRRRGARPVPSPRDQGRRQHATAAVVIDRSPVPYSSGAEESGLAPGPRPLTPVRAPRHSMARAPRRPGQTVRRKCYCCAPLTPAAASRRERTAGSARAVCTIWLN